MDRSTQREAPSRSRRRTAPPREIKVREIMRRQIPVASPEFTLQRAARILRDEGVAELPVCREDVLVGLITDRDLAMLVVAGGANPSTKLEEVLPPAHFFCFEDQDCRVACTLMRENHVERLPVTDSHKHLVGMVLLGDLRE